ncbi:MAG: BtaA family protein [Acidobacteriota bacterium]|nr:BtaA family protein [Acidobacteriota bacterium]
MANSRLLFGRMFEDPQIEIRAFAPNSRVFAIASAGCTAIALANAGHRVTAIDLNPAQIDYVRARVNGGPARTGKIDGLLRAGLRFAPLLGLTRARRETFCAMDDPEKQLGYWKQFLRTARLRMLLRAVLNPLTLRNLYSPQVLSALPPRFDRVLMDRLERGWAIHPNRRNPYARGMLLGEGSPAVIAPGAKVDLVTGGAAEYLETVPERSFDAFTLSNILDGAGEEYGGRLMRAVRKAAAPGARMALRRFAEHAGPNLAAEDRALLWGTVEVAAL